MTAPCPTREDGRTISDDEIVATALSAFLHSLPTRPRLLGFGEPMHGEEAFPELRNLLFRHLAEQEGYRSIALESDCVAALLVDHYVTGGAGCIDDVLRDGFSHGFGESAANRALVEWMRAFNQDRPVEDQLRFFGFDTAVEMTGASSPRPALIALHHYLAAHLDSGLLPCTRADIDRLIGDDARWTNPEAIMDPALSVGDSPEVGELRLLTDDLRTVLGSEVPALVSATSAEHWWRAALHGRTAAGLLRYHAAMADRSAERVNRLMRLRDAMMAANLDAITTHAARRGPILAFAHNRHLQKNKSRWDLPWPGWEGQALEWWSAGAIVGARLDDEYVLLASALGSAEHRGLGAPAPETLEDVLSTCPAGRYLIDAGRLAARLTDFGTGPAARTDNTTDQGYFPLDPAQLDTIDAILFIRELAAPTPPG